MNLPVLAEIGQKVAIIKRRYAWLLLSKETRKTFFIEYNCYSGSSVLTPSSAIQKDAVLF